MRLATTIGAPDSANRDELRRKQRERFAVTSDWAELERRHLTFTRFAIVHEPSGDSFKVYRGEIDAGPTHPASAYFYAQNGDIVFFERLPRR